MTTRMSLPKQMAIGMVLGIVVGMIAPSVGLDASWFKPFGQIFITLIRMVVVPLVFFTLIAGAASVTDVRTLGRVATKTLIYYIFTTALAVTIGLLLANLVQPGLGLSLSTENLTPKQATVPPLVKVLMDIIPLNPIEALSQGKMLQIIFFALLFGFGLSMIGEKGTTLYNAVDGCAETMIKVTNMVMLYAPIGVFALMTVTVATHGLSVLLPLIKLVAVMYLASLCQVLLVYLPCVKFAGVTPGKFFRGLASPLIIAFTTCSSAAALSANMLSVQKMGASKPVSSFSIPLGNTINMDGAAIYMGVAAIFAAEIYGIPMPLDKQLTVLLLAVLASIGSMGVPGAALVMITMVFTQVGIPLEAVALVAGVDRVMDMARTTINVLGDATGALFVTRLEDGKLKPQPENQA
ncbi:MAG: dicarboxylate/amino acid:cation symporter [Desulfovibrio sp.]|nr:dicarboxylate/amino acid:cation symporter [Desulfovibrio sp.]